MMSRSLYKIGKKLCFPDVPSSWIPRTVDFIQRSQDIFLRKKNLKHCIEILPCLPKITEDDDDDQESSFGYDRSQIDDSSVTTKDGFSWSQEHYGTVVKHLMNDRINENRFFSRGIREGDPFDVISLLSKGGDGYLVRNNGDQVQVESLRGKNILVCCFFVPIFWQTRITTAMRGLFTACSHLNNASGEGKYEMVMVAKMRPNWADDEDAFNHFFSGFPSSWLAVPFSDTARCDHVCYSIGLHFEPVGVLVDPNQKVVAYENITYGNGFDYFPLCLPDEDPFTWWKTHSKLDSILVSDYVFKMNNNNASSIVGIDGNKVSISQLKEKLVAMYLCIDGSFIRTLDLVSQECKARNQDFQIVLVHLPYDESVNPLLFQEAIYHVLHNLKISVNSNWWVSPFNDFVSRTLWEVGHCFREDQMVILDPYTNTADPYGKDVLNWFGINSYPFTREFLVRRELEAVRSLTLESLLVYGSRDYLLRININNDNVDEVPVPIAELCGKTVLLYVDEVDTPWKTYYTLLEWYNWAKTTMVADFEVVFIHASFGNPRPMPWLVCPFDRKHTFFVMRKILKAHLGCIVAFGKDGHVITLDAIGLLDSYGPKGFPPYDGLRNEVVSHFEKFYDIDMSDMFDE